MVVTATNEPAGALPGEPLAARRVDLSPAAAGRAPDAAALLKETPGAAIIRNGPQTGIVQLRGLSGDRVKVALDGMTITPACPNHMDPPLHYAAPSGLGKLSVVAGISPVSLGGDNPGGTVIAELPSPRFATNQQTLGFGGIGGFYRSVNDGYGFNGEGGVAGQRWSAAYHGAWQRANDTRFPGGWLRDTGFETQEHGMLAGLKTSSGVWSVDAGLVRTRDAGTPALPMDMIEDDGYRVGLRHLGEYEFGAVQGRFYYHTIDHLMDNFSLRPVPAGAMRMFAPAASDDYGLELGLSAPRGEHTFRAGSGFHLNRFEAYQQNAMTGARQDILNDASRARIGTYAEWQADWSDCWTTVLGLRNDTVLSDAGSIGRFNPPSAADAAFFNARRHDYREVNFDLVATARLTPNDWSTYELGLARKCRAPSLLERYLWTPLSSSAGQADGRTYLGKLDLDSETSYQIAFTADWHGKKWQFQATPFYNWVDGYIQGVPLARLDTAGLRVLQFQNLGRADLYGVDALARYAFDEHWAVRGTLSYVRGINRDNHDALYRLAPLRGLLSLDYRLGAWESSFGVEMASRQRKVAAYNGESPTAGYALMHLRAGYTFRRKLQVEVGVENLANHRYADHLGGVNRVLDSGVAAGQRLPGAGRNVYLQANLQF